MLEKLSNFIICLKFTDVQENNMMDCKKESDYLKVTFSLHIPINLPQVQLLPQSL